MKRFTEINEIELNDRVEASIAKNYPSTGFWITKLQSEAETELYFVNRIVGYVYYIARESVFKDILLDNHESQNHGEVTNMSTFINTPSGYVSEEFVLGFTKLLLKDKK